MTEILIALAEAERLKSLLKLPPGVTVTTALNGAESIARGHNATIAVANPIYVSQQFIDAHPRLEWLQAMSAGTDTITRLMRPPGLEITSASGMHAPQMTELVFLYMLSFLRDMREILAAQAAARWDRRPQRLLTGKRIAIVGIGHISEALAERCKMFGMQVEGLSAHRLEAPHFDRVRPLTELPEAAAAADFLVILTPYTSDTHYLIDAGILDAMKASAILINVARGPVVDTEALVSALRNGWIAGAGLDVFEEEPLPADHPLWRMQNVIVTPHIGGVSDIYLEQLAPIVNENIVRWFARPRRELMNRVKSDG